MSYVANTEVINPFGICLGEELNGEDYAPFVTRNVLNGRSGNAGVLFRTYHGTNNQSGNEQYTHNFFIDIENLIEDYIRRIYNVSNDVELTILIVSFGGGSFYRDSKTLQRTFETETEALEYIDTLGNPTPLIDINPNSSNGRLWFDVTWRQEVEGVFVDRNVTLDYTGDDIQLYTIDDLINFLALFFGVTTEEVLDGVTYTLHFNEPQDTPEPSLDCETYIKATIVDIDGPGETVEIDIDFTASSIPGDVTVTTIDGDPVVSNTMIENGDGSITISDNGFISMRNDGGTFFLNEYGTVGFYATGDASLTADNRVQLGVGQNSVTVENGSLTIRDETGSATLTAEDINNLKDLLS